MRAGLRVLLSAYACQPGQGSEHAIGWNWAQQSARFYETWVLTRERRRPAIEQALATRPAPNLHFVYLDLPKWLRFWKKLPGGVYLYYYVWQILAYFRAKELHREIGFDLVHHATFGMYWIPSFLSLLPAPFVWGPVGGGELGPRQFRSTFGLRGRVYEFLREFAQTLAPLDPFLRLTARRSVLALATTSDTARRLAKLGCRKVKVLSHVGLGPEDLERFHAVASRRKPSGQRFRVFSAGRLLHWKGFHLALMALVGLRDRVPVLEYWVFGDGPERRRLEELARTLGLSDRVTFWGNLPRAELFTKTAECDVLIHPSLHDSGGYVCMEAMAAGCPVVCLDLGGPAIQVTEETGIKIPAVSPEQTVRDLTAALQRLADNPVLRANLANAGWQRLMQGFTWEKKMEAFANSL